MTSDAALWAGLPVPALMLDGEDRITRMNPAAEGFFNCSARSLGAVRLWDVARVDTPVEAALRRARAQDAPLFVNDVNLAVGARAPQQCNLHIAPVTDAPGGMILLIAPRDLAGWMTGPHTLRAAGRSAIGMAEMLSHEIKNPLAGIIGAAQLLSMELAPQQRDLTDLIVSESRRIVTLLERVEQFGHLAAPDLQAVNIHDILERARRSASLGVAARMTVLESYDPSLPEAWADPDQLLQVVQNLLKNAAEAAAQIPRHRGTITLRTRYDHGLRLRDQAGEERALPLLIEVMDDGPGIPVSIAQDVFDPFVSGRENGTGLGLALAARIISDNGGWITVSSVPGNTVFRISLPRAPATQRSGPHGKA